MNRSIFLVGAVLLSNMAIGQMDQESIKQAEKALQKSKDLTYEGNQSLIQNDFIDAEADYRKAISKSNENVAAPYNLGRALYNRENFPEAFSQFKNAGEKATVKPEKHKAFHNLGNVFMKNKEYEKAVEAYKQALRSDPTDDETRYNLALAKKMLEKEQNEQDQNQDDQNEENKNDQNQDQNQDNDNQGDSDQKDQGEDQKDEGDQGDQGNEKPEENKEGDGEKKKEENQQPKPQGDEKEPDKSPRPNQLSEQQIQNLLEAMQNEEKKVQEKLNAQKVRGAKIKNEKDW